MLHRLFFEKLLVSSLGHEAETVSAWMAEGRSDG